MQIQKGTKFLMNLMPFWSIVERLRALLHSDPVRIKRVAGGSLEVGDRFV
jgi:hypothetical protein